ncbi:MAG: glycoside hydrolase family 127 protein [Eubacterium sp.]|nr:glycoside hydrolase family 127 protein [Eubacterium sp.]
MKYSKPVLNNTVKITDTFWKEKIELVRKEVIPYQWRALNDEVESAEPSYSLRNFELAADCIKKRKRGIKTPIFPTNEWHYTPDVKKEDSFYGWIFQDSDLYKWIEAVSYSLENTTDVKLEALTDKAIDLICNAQMENGYIDTFYTINNPEKAFTNLRDHHELYCFGHLAEAAVAYYHATGKDKLLNAACRFADLLCEEFGENGKAGYDGHEIAEMALIRLYEATDKEKYLTLAKRLVDNRGTKPYYFDIEHNKDSGDRLDYFYNQAHLPVREQNEAVGHAVRAVYLYSGMADVARYTNDEELFNVCKTIFDDITERKMYVTGGIGSTNHGEAFTFAYDLPNDLAYAETCASIGLVFFARRMLQADFDSKYADIMERCIYNGILSGMAEDGKSFFYVNPLEVNPEACKKDSRKHHIKPIRQKWFDCACCPPNLARLVSDYGEYCFTETENTLFINLYQSAEIKTDKADIEIISDYLNSGKVSFKIKAKKAFKLALRIPYWSNHFTFSKENPFIKKGYAYFDIENEDEITAEFNPEIKIIKCNSNVRENMGKVAVTRGPIVYCLEEADNGKSLHLLRLSRKPKFSFDGENIMVNGYKEEITTKRLYTEYNDAFEKPVRLKFIPYYKWANRGENEMSVYIRY